MANRVNDIQIKDNAPTVLLLDKHAAYIAAYGVKKDEYDYAMSDFLRVSGMYWGLTAMDLMNKQDSLDRQGVIDYVQQCQHNCGGFGASVKHDPHLLSTLSAIQILSIYDCVDVINVEKVVKYVSSMQQNDGSFAGDKWGEIDTRLTFCGVACLALLKRLDAINLNKAVEYILSCMNFDGGFGCRPGSESHSGLIYCSLGILAIAGQLHHVKADLLGWWLCERQLPSGGLNGRPEKLPDVCYSWWVLAALKILGRIHWIDKDKLALFILAAQDDETGGIADRPGDVVDPFHTLFGLTGLSLLGHKQLRPINPVFCMPQYIIDRIGCHPQLLKI